MTRSKSARASATEVAADDVTRIAAIATRTRYDSVSIALHWLTAVLVLALFGLAELWGFTGRPTRHVMIAAHMTLGIMLSLVIVVRIAWRLTPGHQVEPLGMGWVERTATVVQYLLYALLLVQVILGYALRWGGGKPLIFFGLELPSPFAALPKPVTHILFGAHNYIGWTIAIIATGHGAAALYHHFVLHDGVLARMLPRGAVNAENVSR